MNVNFGPVSLLEIIWTIAALPGLWLWFRNWIEALRTRRYARLAGVTNGRMIWAQFSVWLTFIFVFIELFFVGLGGIAMMRYPVAPVNPGWLNYFSAAGFIAVSMAVTYVGLLWRNVDRHLIQASRKRQTTQDPVE